MTDEHIHLYALARVAVPPEVRVSTIAEKTSGGHTMYTIVVDDGKRRRWFAVHSLSVHNLIADSIFVPELRRALGLSPTSRDQVE